MIYNNPDTTPHLSECKADSVMLVPNKLMQKITHQHYEMSKAELYFTMMMEDQ